MGVEIDITKKLAEYTLHIAFSAENEHLALLGASGSGKSMTLKCIAGIETPDSGFIRIQGRTVFDSTQRINIKPKERNCGYLFQNYALFPHMSVRQNIELVLHKLEKNERKKRTAEILEQFGIGVLADRTSAELSGGQMQRVALARMMVKNPEIIMLDEPFSALDSFIRQQTEDEVASLLEGFSGTVLFVSHNRDEVYRLCKYLQVIEKGSVCASGTTVDLFKRPRNVVTARLTGCKNIARCISSGSHSVFVPDWALNLTVAETVGPDIRFVGIRAHYLRYARENEIENVYTFSILSERPSPFSTSVYIAVPLAPSQLLWETGVADTQKQGTVQKTVKLCLPAEAIILLSE